VIGPLLRVVASTAAARSLRVAAREAATNSLLMLGAGVALAVSALCLSCAAFVVIDRNIDRASAWAIVGAFWGLVGLLYFVATSRRRD